MANETSDPGIDPGPVAGAEPGAEVDGEGDPEPFDEVPSNLTVVLEDGDIEHLGASEPTDNSEPTPRAKTVPPPAPVVRRRAETSLPPPTPSPRPSPARSPLPGVSAVEPARFDIEVPTALESYLEVAASSTPQERFAALKEDLERADGDKVAGELAYELGEVAMHELGDEASAVKAYGRALQIDPSLRANLWAIRRIFYGRALWPNLVKLIGAEIRFVESDRDRADLEVEKGQLYEDRLGDPDEAKQCYLRAFAHDSRYLPGLLALERRCLIDNDREGLATVWRALADAAESRERKLGYLLDLALSLAEQGAGDGAAAALDEAAALELDHGALAEIARRRAQIARQIERPAMMIAALDERIRARLAELGPGGLPEPASREPGEPLDRTESIRLEVVALRRRQARIAATELDDPEAAWTALEQALAAAPRDELVLSDLADLAERLGRFDELAELVEGWQASESEPARARALALRRVAALRRSGQAESAAALLEQLGATTPGFVPIAAAREAEAIAAGDLGALATIYAELGESAAAGALFGGGAEPDPAAAASFFIAAAAAAQVAGRRDQSTQLYRRALDAAPTDRAAASGLLDGLEAAGDLDGAADALRAIGPSGEGDRIRLAAIECARGRYREAAEALEEAVADLEADELLWLATLWERAGDPVAAARGLETAAERFDPAAAGQLLARAATLLEPLDSAAATELYRKALAARPEDRLSRGLLHALLRRDRDWEALAAALRDAAAAGGEVEEVAAAWGELAAVLEDRLHRPEEAAAAYREMAALVPEDAAASCGLLRVSRGEDRIEALERVAAAADPRARLDALIRLARLHADADRLELALETAERGAESEREAGLVTSIADLIAIEVAAQLGSETLATALERAAERQGARLGARLLAAAGLERAIGAGDFDGAAPLFERARERDPGSRDALFGALLCRVQRGERGAEADAAAALAESIEGTSLAAALLRSSAAVAAVEGDEAAAARRFAGAAARGPADLAAQAALTQIAARPGDAREAEITAAACARRAEASAGRARDRWLLGQARALEAAGKLAEAGRVALDLCRRERPDPAALDLLAAIARRGGDHRSEAIALLSLADALGDPAAELECLRRAAALFDDELADAAAASAVYRRLLGADPLAPEHARWIAILEEAEDLAGLWDAYSRRLEDPVAAELAPAERAALLRGRAQIRRRLGDDLGAARDLEASLEDEPDSGEALLALGAALSTREPGRAATALRAFIATNPPAEVRADAEVRLAEILAEEAGDLAGAAAEIHAALELRPDDLDLRERHVGLLIRCGDGEGAIVALDELARRKPVAADRARDQVRIASVYRDLLGDREKAVLALDRARVLDPLNLDAVRELVEMIGGDRERMETILEQADHEINRSLDTNPGTRSLYQKLAAVASWRGESERQRLALAAAAALGPQREDPPPAIAVTPSLAGGPIGGSLWRGLGPRDAGFIDELWSLIADAVSKLRDPEPAALGLSRSDRVRGRHLDSRFPALAALVSRLGLRGSIYVAGSDRHELARVAGGSDPTIILSEDVAAAGSAGARFLLGCALAMARDGTGTLELMEVADLELQLAAAASIAGVDPLPPALAAAAADRPALAAAAQALDRALPWRGGKELSARAERFADIGDVGAWRRGALAAARRFGLALAGDLEPALARAGAGGSVRESPEALDLLRFATSREHLALRAALGFPEASS